MKEFLWRRLAKWLAQPERANRLIMRSQGTPYTHIYKQVGDTDVPYMTRWWLFNPYPRQFGGPAEDRWYSSLLPSLRIHHILRPDQDREPHDHPWLARTIILRGGYTEQRAGEDHERILTPGDTAKLELGMYHQITEVPEQGAWTLFITWKYQGTWGFLVNNRKVPWREYLGLNK